MESEKRNDTNELTYKTERDSQTWRTDLQRPGEGVYTECGINMDTLLYFKWITNKDLCRAHGTLLNVMWQPGWEGLWGRTDTCICMAESLHCSPETITTLFISYKPIQT